MSRSSRWRNSERMVVEGGTDGKEKKARIVNEKSTPIRLHRALLPFNSVPCRRRLIEINIQSRCNYLFWMSRGRCEKKKRATSVGGEEKWNDKSTMDSDRWKRDDNCALLPAAGRGEKWEKPSTRPLTHYKNKTQNTEKYRRRRRCFLVLHFESVFPFLSGEFLEKYIGFPPQPAAPQTHKHGTAHTEGLTVLIP